MATKRQTTRAKMDREQAVKEKRARKQQKKDDRRQAALDPGHADQTLAVSGPNGETPAE